MLTSPPFAFFCFALICSLFSIVRQRRIHSVQRNIEFLHSGSWPFHQKAYDQNQEFLRKNRRFGLIAGLFAACFAIECLFGHHFAWSRFDFFLVACGSLTCILGITACYVTRRSDLFDGQAALSAGAMFAVCVVFGFSWILGTAAVPIFFTGWYFLQPNDA